MPGAVQEVQLIAVKAIPRRQRHQHGEHDAARRAPVSGTGRGWPGGREAGDQRRGFGLHVAGEVIDVGQQRGVRDQPEIQGIRE